MGDVAPSYTPAELMELAREFIKAHQLPYDSASAMTVIAFIVWLTEQEGDSQ